MAIVFVAYFSILIFFNLLLILKLLSLVDFFYQWNKLLLLDTNC